MTHIEALELERVPEHLIVLGGGYVGLEFAQAMRRFRSETTRYFSSAVRWINCRATRSR